MESCARAGVKRDFLAELCSVEDVHEFESGYHLDVEGKRSMYRRDHLRRGRIVAAVATGTVLVIAGRIGAVAAGEKDAGRGTDEPYRLSIGGQEREFLVHVPAGYAATKRYPVVVMLHGAGGDGPGAERETGWDRKADEEEFIAVFPTALAGNPARTPSFLLNPRYWDDGSGRGTRVRGNIDDIAFLGAVLDDVEKRYSVDTQRVYLTGFSSGASMTFHAAVAPTLCTRFAAAAPVSGQFWDTDAKPARALPTLLLFGTEDPLNPMEGGMTRTPWGQSEKQPILQSVQAYAKVMGAPAEPAPLDWKKPGVKVAAYGPGRNGAIFLYATVEGAGHTWMDGREVLPERLMGKRTHKLNATDTIWRFFAKQVLADRVTAP